MNLKDRVLDVMGDCEHDRYLMALLSDILTLIDPLTDLVAEAERAEPLPGTPLFNATYRVKDILEPPLTMAQIKAAQQREKLGWRGRLSPPPPVPHKDGDT